MSRSILHRAAFALALAALCLAFATGRASAQSTTNGAIGGTVKDPNGAVVAGAAVAARNKETNREGTATTDDQGAFRVPQLEPGNYVVTINASGFGAYTKDPVVVEVGRVTTVDVDLALTAQTETVDVTSEAPVINTVQQDFATNINQVSISELPINGRRASDFVRLTPGVTPEGDFGLNSFRGISALLNNNTLDGTDNNNGFFSEERGRTRIQYSFSQAAVREFQVNTSNYSAEYGRAGGGVINTVSKSGTNEFHGQAFYYIRDNKWGARNPSAFLPGNIPIKPHDRRQQFGAAIGGPIVRDKAFFFFTYDQQKRTFPVVLTFSNPAILNPITLVNPTASGRACTTSTGAIPTGSASLTVGETLFCRLVTPGRSVEQAQASVNGGLDFLRSLTGTAPRKQDQRIIFPKVDWNISDKHTLSATYNHLRTDAPGGFTSRSVDNIGLASVGNDFVDVDSFNARLSSIISPSLLNEFRFQVSHELNQSILGDLTAGEETLADRATTLVNGRLPEVSLSGFNFGTRAFFQRQKFPDENRIQFADTVTYTRGNHTLKFGGDYKRDHDHIDNLFQGFGSYNYSNISDFLSDFIVPTGTPNNGFATSGNAATITRRYNTFAQAFGLTEYKFSTPDYAFFVQDDWRVSSTVTLNLGLRYDYQSYSEPQVPNTLTPTLAAGQTRYSLSEAQAIINQTTRFPKDKNNWGPRLGFAWDIMGDGKTSLRGGYGIYYGRVPNTFIASAIVNTGAPGSQIAVTGVSPTTVLRDANNNVIPTPSFPNSLSGVPLRSTNMVVLSPEFENPKVYQADIIFEREIGRNTVVSASYIYSGGRDLPAYVDLNLPLPTATRTYTVVGGPFNGQSFTTAFFAGARPISNVGQILETQSASESEYRALVLQANRRLTNGLQFQANYTYSKAEDLGQRFGTFAPGSPTVSNPFDFELDRGLSDNDIPHRFVVSAVWLPGQSLGLEDTEFGRVLLDGFTVSPIVNVASGRTIAGSIGSNPGAGGTLGGTSTGLLGSGGPSRAFFIERNSFRRPYTATVDLRVSRRFGINEDMNIEFLAEAFNLFNRANVTDVSATLFTFQNATATGGQLLDRIEDRNVPFLRTTAEGINNTTIFTPRQVQLSVRFNF